MKYAFMTFSCPHLTLDELLATARRYGYDGIEPRTAVKHRHGIELDATAADRRDIRRKAVDSGIALCSIATSCAYANPATSKQMVDDTLRHIDLADDVGSPAIRVFGGVIPHDVSREHAIDAVAQALQSVADHAQQRNVAVCVETHDDWCTPSHLADVMKRVDHPAIAVNWDIMHPVRVAGVTMDQAHQTLRPWIRHVHFHDGVTKDDQLTLVPIGAGPIDHRRAVELLLSAGYDGFLSGEWANWDDGYELHLPRELAAIKAYENR